MIIEQIHNSKHLGIPSLFYVGIGCGWLLVSSTTA